MELHIHRTGQGGMISFGHLHVDAVRLTDRFGGSSDSSDMSPESAQPESGMATCLYAQMVQA